MCAPTRSSGRWVKYLDEADQTLTQLDGDQHQGAGPGLAPVAPTARSANQKRPPRGRSAGTPASACSWAINSGARPLRAAPWSPACGPLPVTQVPITSTAAVTTVSTRVRARSGAGHGRRHRPGRLDGASPEGVRGPQHRHRGEEVQPDHPRVEVAEHGDAADHALRRDAEEDRDRERQQCSVLAGPSPAPPPGRPSAISPTTKVTIRLLNSMIP